MLIFVYPNNSNSQCEWCPNTRIKNVTGERKMAIIYLPKRGSGDHDQMMQQHQ